MDDWQVLRRETVFRAGRFFEVVKECVRTTRGEVIDDFYRVELSPFALAVPVLEDGSILLIKQYKHGPGRVSLTFPAGFVDAGETPAQACARELCEETGLAAREMVALGSFVDNGNQRGCIGHHFLALGCRAVAVPDPGDLEDMTYLYLTPAQIDAELNAGGFAIAHHVTGWLLARDRLRDGSLR